MNKISMDALNRGWSIGFGTRVHAGSPDFEAALNRASAEAPEAVKSPSLAELAAAYVETVESFFASFRRRPAH